MKAIDLIGKKFGSWTAIKRLPTRYNMTQWECICVCGSIKSVSYANLSNGKTTNCGCLKNVTHGLTALSEYSIWACMKNRCLSSSSDGYNIYGGRGIKVCQRWMKFENFLSDMGPRPSDIHSIDRINNDGDYKPSNCRWATPKEQARNRRTCNYITFNGVTKTEKEWCDDLGLHKGTISLRIKSGWPLDKALFSSKYGRTFSLTNLY